MSISAGATLAKSKLKFTSIHFSSQFSSVQIELEWSLVLRWRFREELFQFQMFKAAQLATAAGTSTAAAAAAAVDSSSAHPWFLTATSSLQSYPSLPITPRCGSLHSLRGTSGGPYASLPTTGVLNYLLLGGAPAFAPRPVVETPSNSQPPTDCQSSRVAANDSDR